MLTVIIHANEVYGFFFSICVKLQTRDPNMNQSLHTGEGWDSFEIRWVETDDLKHETQKAEYTGLTVLSMCKSYITVMLQFNQVTNFALLGSSWLDI